ncbi:hypothetical protein Tsubulata_016026, partial [Turnera subulata]
MVEFCPKQKKFNDGKADEELLLLSGTGDTNVVEAETRAYVLNMLETGENMTIHCQSKYHDLGNVTLAFGQQLEWYFHDFLGFRFYWCYAIWDSSPDWNYFVSYYGFRDFF